MDDACSRSRARVESRNAASHTALHGRRSRRVPRRAIASTSATTVARVRFLSPSRAFAKGNGEENEIEPGLRQQRLRRYQIPRTALSRAFTPDDVVVPSLPSLAFCAGLLNSPGEIVLSFRPRAACCTGRAQKHFIII